MSALLQTPLPALDDREDEHVPPALPAVIDAHVHLFPDHMFASIWKWFEKFGWPIRYRLGSPEVIEFLLSRSVSRIVGLQYAHKPGVARELNVYMAKLCSRYQQLIGMATVFPVRIMRVKYWPKPLTWDCRVSNCIATFNVLKC
jgi:hypothetical protein